MEYIHQTFKLHFLLGLPASGKSYWARQNFNTNTFCNHTGDFIVDLDKYVHNANGNLTAPVIYEALDNSDMKAYVGETYNTHKVVKVCIDGLITDIGGLTKVIDSTIEYINNRCNVQYDIKLYIHQWNEDRDACIHNDRMRVESGERKNHSETTIRNHPYEYIENEQLAKYRENNHISAIKFERHIVKKITIYDTMFAPLIGYDKLEYHDTKNKKTKYMYSESWSGGGSWKNCWGNGGTISPDTPKDFKEFDDFLMKICPKISFLQYKKLINECIETEEDLSYDYYGGREYRHRWKCDMEKLYDMLKEMNLI